MTKEKCKLVYSGERLREFLRRNNISYKQAAEELGIDKNTVGKAVRGGNLNSDIILHICNTYNMPVSDFFVEVRVGYDSSSPEQSSAVAEPEVSYKNSKNRAEIDARIEEIQSLLDILNAKCDTLFAQWGKTRAEQHNTASATPNQE